MSKRKRDFNNKNSGRIREADVEISEANDYYDVSVMPDVDNSGESDCSSERDEDSEDDYDSDAQEVAEFEFPKSFRTVSSFYTESQKKLEPNHIFDWIDGEVQYKESLENETQLKLSDIKKIKESSFTEIFEFFFSSEIKQYIIDCTASYGFELSLDNLNTFLGIIIFSCFNKRLSQRDYWSKDSFLRAEQVASSMGIKKFEIIKSNLKLHKSGDENKEDKIWRVRKFMNILRKNILQFGFFSTGLAIDEMMIKYFGKCSLKQFIRSKPIRFGIKMWGIASANGYLYDFDIYCGKNAKHNTLPKCSLGTRVVIQMCQCLLSNTSIRNLKNYHIYFDNLFCSADLLVHLKKLGLRCTGTVRQDRVPLKHTVDKKDDRGTYQVMYDKNSGVNYITVMDAKPVSILSTAAGVNPIASVKRYNKKEKKRQTINFPRAFCVYNKNMGGIDIHDQHCNKVLPLFRSKKWTWVIFLRCIQVSITNATVFYNTVITDENKKIGTKDVIAVAKSYLKQKKTDLKQHLVIHSTSQKNCSNEKCSLRTRKFCKTCELYFCKNCFSSTHSE